MGLFSVKADSALGRLLRMVALIAVVLAVGYGFWLSNEQTMRKLKERGNLNDAALILDETSLAEVKDYATWLKESYGLTLRLMTTSGVLDIPDLKPDVVFLGIGGIGQEQEGKGPSQRVVVVELPPLLTRSLPPDMDARLEATLQSTEDSPPLDQQILTALRLLRDALHSPSNEKALNPAVSIQADSEKQ